MGRCFGIPSRGTCGVPLIGPDDIEAFRDANAGAFAAASKFVAQAQRGLPHDRYAPAQDMPLVAAAIAAQWQIIAWLTDSVAAMQAEKMQAAQEAMALFPRSKT